MPKNLRTIAADDSVANSYPKFEPVLTGPVDAGLRKSYDFRYGAGRQSSDREGLGA